VVVYTIATLSSVVYLEELLILLLEQLAHNIAKRSRALKFISNIIN
jgi:hypothetical protein